MKNLLKIFAALVLSLTTAQAFTYTTAVNTGAGGTNTLTPLFDVSGGSTVLGLLSFTGAGDRNTASTISVLTNTPAANSTLAITLGTNTSNYSWQTTPTVSNYTYSASAPLAKIGVENAPNGGDTLTVIRSDGTTSYTNVFTWVTLPVTNQTQILATNTANQAATNLYRALSTFAWTPTANVYPLASYYTAKGVQLAGRPNETWFVTNSATWATNLNTTYYTVTNATATNASHIAYGTNSPISTTNLFNKLVSDYGTNLTITWTTPTNIVLTTPSTNMLTVTASSAWGSASTTSNALSPTGVIRLVASNSVDGVTFFADPARTFTVAFNGYTNVTFQTNFASVVFPFLQYTLENPYTNYTKASGFQFKVGAR
jgi:hypothetical protein